MTLTKEQLIEEAKQAVEGCRRLLRVSPGVEAHKISLRLAEITLASLTAEPVGFIARHKETGDFGSWLHPKADWFKGDKYEILNAYTTQPAPVVPDAISTRQAISKMEEYALCDSINVAFKYGWNACRAAMFQGAAGNSPAIPDGWALVPIEPTEDMIINGFESEPDESFSDEKEWEAYDAMSGCQQAAHRAKLCWAAMIAAAPQQEVKL